MFLVTTEKSEIKEGGYIFNTQVSCVHSLLSLPILSHFVTNNNVKEETALVLTN